MGYRGKALALAERLNRTQDQVHCEVVTHLMPGLWKLRLYSLKGGKRQLLKEFADFTPKEILSCLLSMAAKLDGGDTDVATIFDRL